MRIAIFGVGAMGCLFGARLTPYADVTLIGHWPQQIKALRLSRLQIIHPDGHKELASLNAATDPGQVEPVDAVLILTKSVGTEAAASGAAQILKPEGIAVTLQNGLGHHEILAAYVGKARAVLGITAQGAATDGPGVLRYGGEGTTHLTTHPAIDGRVRDLAAVFNQAGLPTEVVEDASALVWSKLAINCAINPLTAILRARNGTLIESEWALGILQDAAREVEAVAAAQGIGLLGADAAVRAAEVAALTGANRSSMLQDVLRGVPTEIDAICGAVVEAGRDLDVPTPVNEMLHRLVKAIEESYTPGQASAG